MAHRLQTLFLTLLLILGLTVFPVFAEEDDGSWDGWNDNGWYDDLPEEETEPDEVIFPDVQPGSWYYKDVMALYDARVIDGFKDGTFQPESTVTTGQALKMILLAAGYGEPERVAIEGGIGTFTDCLWDSLNNENKVSLFVRYIDVATGRHETRIVNKNK